MEEESAYYLKCKFCGYRFRIPKKFAWRGYQNELAKQEFRAESTVRIKIKENLSNELNRICSQLELPKIVEEEARFLYNQQNRLRDKKLEKISTKLKVIACLLISCEKSGIFFNKNEFEELSQAPLKEVLDTKKLIMKELKIQVTHQDLSIPSICSKLNLPPNIEIYCYDLLEKIKVKKIFPPSKSHSITAAVIYISCIMNNNKKSQREIAAAIRVSEVSLRNKYKTIVNKLKLKMVNLGV